MKRIKTYTILSSGILFLAMPMIAMAQGQQERFTIIENILDEILNWVNIFIPILMALAFVAFLWGLAMFIFKAGDEEGRKTGRHIMIWGIIALAVIATVWGIIAFLGDIVGVRQDEETLDPIRIEQPGQ